MFLTWVWKTGARERWRYWLDWPAVTGTNGFTKAQTLEIPSPHTDRDQSKQERHPLPYTAPAQDSRALIHSGNFKNRAVSSRGLWRPGEEKPPVETFVHSIQLVFTGLQVYAKHDARCWRYGSEYRQSHGITFWKLWNIHLQGIRWQESGYSEMHATFILMTPGCTIWGKGDLKKCWWD